MSDSPASVVFDFDGNPVHIPAIGTPAILSTAGNHVLHTPSAGKSIRLRWIGCKCPSSNYENLDIEIYLGSNIIYKWNMESPDIFSHSTVREGLPNESLSIELLNDQQIYVNLDLEEF